MFLVKWYCQMQMLHSIQGDHYSQNLDPNNSTALCTLLSNQYNRLSTLVFSNFPEYFVPIIQFIHLQHVNDMYDTYTWIRKIWENHGWYIQWIAFLLLGSMSKFLFGFISLFRLDLISWDTKKNYPGANNTLDINQHPPSRTASHVSSTNECSLLDLFSKASSVGVFFCVNALQMRSWQSKLLITQGCCTPGCQFG